MDKIVTLLYTNLDGKMSTFSKISHVSNQCTCVCVCVCVGYAKRYIECGIQRGFHCKTKLIFHWCDNFVVNFNPLIYYQFKINTTFVHGSHTIFFPFFEKLNRRGKNGPKLDFMLNLFPFCSSRMFF